VELVEQSPGERNQAGPALREAGQPLLGDGLLEQRPGASAYVRLHRGRLCPQKIGKTLAERLGLRRRQQRCDVVHQLLEGGRAVRRHALANKRQGFRGLARAPLQLGVLRPEQERLHEALAFQGVGARKILCRLPGVAHALPQGADGRVHDGLDGPLRVLGKRTQQLRVLIRVSFGRTAGVVDQPEAPCVVETGLFERPHTIDSKVYYGDGQQQCDAEYRFGAAFDGAVGAGKCFHDVRPRRRAKENQACRSAFARMFV